MGSGVRNPIEDAWNEVSGNNSRGRANAAQQRSAEQAQNTLSSMYNQQRSDMEPYKQAGLSSLTSLQNNDFMNNFQGDPGFQFRMQQGANAINAGAGARGMRNSGATMKALTRYGQDFASNEYNNAYNRNYQRLSNLANTSFNAASNQANAAQGYGNQVSGIQTGLGNAQAASAVSGWNTAMNLGGQMGGAALGGYLGRK
jgi:hypothetical protein